MTSQTPYEDLLRDNSIKASKTGPEGLFVHGCLLLPDFALVFAGLDLFLIRAGSRIVDLFLTTRRLLAFGSMKAVGTRKRLSVEQVGGMAR